VKFRPNASIGIAYDGQFGTGLSDQGVKGKLVATF
jgi:hypothetical protein